MSKPLPQELQEALASSASQRFIVMTCGIAGSGKSTLAHALVATYPNFIRLSVDAYVFTTHGLAGIDCPISQYSRNQKEAQIVLKQRFREILREGMRDVVLDFSFYDREYRNEWRGIICEELGNSWKLEAREKLMLIYFEAEEDVLWKRIEERRKTAERQGRGADDAFVISRAMLGNYVRGFEPPESDEEAIVIKVE